MSVFIKMIIINNMVFPVLDYLLLLVVLNDIHVFTVLDYLILVVLNDIHVFPVKYNQVNNLTIYVIISKLSNTHFTCSINSQSVVQSFLTIDRYTKCYIVFSSQIWSKILCIYFWYDNLLEAGFLIDVCFPFIEITNFALRSFSL